MSPCEGGVLRSVGEMKRDRFVSVAAYVSPAISSVLLFLPVAWVATGGLWESAGLLCVVAVAGLVVRNTASLVLGFGGALSLASLAVVLFAQIDSGYVINAAAFTIMVGSSWLAIGVVISRWLLGQDSSLGIAPAAVFAAVMSVFVAPLRDWDAVTSFGVVASHGEDNGAWLIALARVVSDDQTVVSAAGSFAGGHSTGVHLSIWRQIAEWFADGTGLSVADNALVLSRSYVLLAVVAAVMTLVMCWSILREAAALFSVVASVVVSVVAFGFQMGYATVGHFSALVATMYLLIGVTAASVRIRSARMQMAQDALVVAAVVAAGQAWFPLTGLAVLYVFVRAAVAVGSRRARSGGLRMSVPKVVLSVAGLLAFLRLNWLLFPTFFGNVIDLDYVTRNLTLAGGYTSANPWVVVFGLTVAVLFAFGNVIDRTSVSMTVYVPVVVLPPVALFVWAYFLPPYAPQYGAWKYLYLSAAVATPFALSMVFAWLRERLPDKSLSVVPVFVVLFGVMFSPPMSNVTWTQKAPSSAPSWAEGVVETLERDPTRSVACLNTIKDDEARNIDAYVCSRVAFGLGGFDDYRHRTWTAANICSVSAEQMIDAWPAADQDNLTVLLFEPQRRSSGVGCQIGGDEAPEGWLSGIDWSRIETVGPDGTPAYPRADE